MQRHRGDVAGLHDEQWTAFNGKMLLERQRRLPRVVVTTSKGLRHPLKVAPRAQYAARKVAILHVPPLVH